MIFSSRDEYFEIFSLIGASLNIDLKVYQLVIDTVDEQESRFEDSLIATICRHLKVTGTRGEYHTNLMISLSPARFNGDKQSTLLIVSLFQRSG